MLAAESTTVKAGEKTVEVGEAAQQSVLDVFRQWDKTNDGEISKYELHAALNQLGLSEKQITVLWTAMDLNGDGRVEYKEFLSFLYHDASVAKKYNLRIASQKLRCTSEASLEQLGRTTDPGASTKHVFAAVMAILGLEDLRLDSAWTRATVVLRQGCVDKLLAVNVDEIGNQTLSRLQNHTANGQITVDELQGAARSLAGWVLAVEAACCADIKRPQ